MPSEIRYTSFPRTKPPPDFAAEVVGVFRSHEASISTKALEKGLESKAVLKVLASGLVALGFAIETSKNSKIERPVFFGEDGVPSLRYEIDGYHAGYRCGIEIEAGRAILGNAIFRDLFQAMVMTDLDFLVLAVPNVYKHVSRGKPVQSAYYPKTISVCDALYGHSRVKMPYGVVVEGY